MFDFFKKKKTLTDEDLDFLQKVAMALPVKYSYLVEQVSRAFIVNKKKNDLGDEGTYVFEVDAVLASRYTNRNLPQFFILKDISIWNVKKQKYTQMELHIMEGMLIGFRLTSPYSELDLNTINTKCLKEKHFVNKDNDDLKHLLSEMPSEMLSKLDVDLAFKTTIDHKDYFIIKDLGDGNYISMDEKGAVYGMIHDPYEIEEIYQSKEAFLTALQSGEFDPNEYYNSKML